MGDQRAEDVGHQRPALGLGVHARADRPGRRPAVQGNDLLHRARRSPARREHGGPGLTVPPQIKKLGYKGVESTELVFDGYRTPADSILGGERRA